jgi:hypothetical protein
MNPWFFYRMNEGDLSVQVYINHKNMTQGEMGEEILNLTKPLS